MNNKHCEDKIMAQNTNSEMTFEQAAEVIKAPSLVNYSKEEVLKAVELVKADGSMTSDLEAFYEKYYNETKEMMPNYNEFATLKSIFVDTDYAERLQNDVDTQAANFAESFLDSDLNDVKEISFGDLDNTLALLNAAKSTDSIKNAAAKLQDTAAAKLEDALVNTNAETDISVGELEAVERLIGKVENTEQKAKMEEAFKEIKSQFDKEDGLDAEPEVLERNDKSLGEHLDTLTLFDENGEVSKEFGALQDILNNVAIEDEDAEVDASARQKNLEMLFDAAKLEAYQANIGNIHYLLSSKTEQRNRMAEDINIVFCPNWAWPALRQHLMRRRPKNGKMKTNSTNILPIVRKRPKSLLKI